MATVRQPSAPPASPSFLPGLLLALAALGAACDGLGRFLDSRHPLPEGLLRWGALSLTVLCLLLVAAVVRSRQALREERALARRDALTGLLNRRALLEAGAAECSRLRRQALPLTAVYVDCDHFKEVNDSWGHEAGDRVLGAVAAALEGSARRTDLLARLGGDEFVLLLPGAQGADARRTVGLLRTRLDAAMRAGGWPVTFSIGVATWEAVPDGLAAVLASADSLMYDAKRAGRDTACFGEVARSRAA